MKIEDLRVEEQGTRTRVMATVSWEDCDRGRQEIYFETEKPFAEGLSCNPHAFLIAAVIPALWCGEQRVYLEGEVSPELQDGLNAIMSLFKHWYGLARDVVRIEAKTISTRPSLRTAERAGAFFTGGIDSLATLRTNRLAFPPSHPGSIKDGIIVYGLEMDRPEAFDHVWNCVAKVAEDAKITLIPVYTNIRYLHDDWTFWYDAYMGAALAAVAHALIKRLTIVSIASDYDIPNLRPHGSHPLVEPNFSSYDLRIKYDGITLSRLAKTRLVADWQVALQNIRVCNKTEYYRPGMLNCGQCEKCIRTMLALLASDALKKTGAFPQTDVSEGLVRANVRLNDRIAPFYEELIVPLEEKGRDDLARAIKRKLAFRRGEIGWKDRLRRFDRRYMDATLARFARVIHARLS